MVKNPLSYAGNCLLILCAAFCALGALASGFDFASSMSMYRLFLVLLLATLAITALVMLYRGKGLLIMAAPAALLLIWNFARIVNGFKWVANNITARYSNWLPIPELFSAENLREIEGDAVIFLAAVGIALVLSLAAAICLRRSALLTVLATLPFVLLTFVLTETQASAAYLLGLIAVYLTLLISSAIEPDDFAKSAALFVPMFLASALFAGAIYAVNPPAKYERSERVSYIRYYVNNAAEQVIEFVSRLRLPGSSPELDNGWFEVPDDGAWAFNTNNVSIADAGGLVISNQGLLEIHSSIPGTFYIKGFSLSDFDGRAWASNENMMELLGIDEIITQLMPAGVLGSYSAMHAQDPDAADHPLPLPAEMNIQRLNDVTNVGYRPYYPVSSGMSYGARHSPYTGRYDEYAEVVFFYIPGSVRDYLTENAFINEVWFVEGDEETSAEDALLLMESWYTRIDPDTAAGLRQLAVDAGIDPTAEREAVADAVAAYVRSAGRYSLTPPAIPEGVDFAMYFLQVSQEGYCIHYATAATLMLRALDVPARFTSGYVATVSRANVDMPVMLTDRNAHAWVEVLYEDVGWLPLEATPSARGTLIPPAQPHSPAQQPDESQMPSPSPGGPSTPTPPSSSGQGTASGANARAPLPEVLVNIIIIVGLLIALVLTLVIRRHVLNALRNKRFAQKDANAAVISMWRYAVRLNHKQAIAPTDIEELALKARFSQHRITEEERKYMLAYVSRLASELYESKGEYSRVWFRYIRGLA